MRQLCKGNVAIVKGALLAGCRSYYGYPITPASEIAEAAAEYMPQVGGTFLQAESEVAAINMVYGAASAGLRVMTASSVDKLEIPSELLSEPSLRLGVGVGGDHRGRGGGSAVRLRAHRGDRALRHWRPRSR